MSLGTLACVCFEGEPGDQGMCVCFRVSLRNRASVCFSTNLGIGDSVYF